jgi:tetratricopeptide (TPR) repeat protein
VLFAKGKVDEFLAAQKQSVELHEQLAGPNDPETLAAFENLGVAYNLHGDFAEALVQYRTARDAFTKLMGPTYPNIGQVDSNEAELLVEQGHPAEAIPLAEQAIKILLATRGPTHENTIDAQNTYAEALLHSGDIRRAAAYFDDREPAMSKAVEADSTDAGDLADTRASIDRAIGDPTKAITVLDRAITTRREDDPQLATLLTRVAQCDLDLKRPRDALAALERAVQVGTQRQLEPTKLAVAKFELARVLVATGGDAKRARSLASEALAVFEHAQMTRASEAKAWLDANK